MKNLNRTGISGLILCMLIASSLFGQGLTKLTNEDLVKLQCACFETNKYPLKYKDVNGAYELEGHILKQEATAIEFHNLASGRNISIPSHCISDIYKQVGTRTLDVELAIAGGLVGAVIGVTLTEEDPKNNYQLFSNWNDSHQSTLIIRCYSWYSIWSFSWY